MRYLSTEQFIERAKKVHTDYDYSLVKYTKSQNKITIICSTHGEFQQTPNNHLRGQGCPICAVEKVAKSNSQTAEQFLHDALVVHGNRYDYSKSVFKKNNQKIIIICREHGEFLQTPHIHTYEQAGCYKCGRQHVANLQRKSTDDYITEAKIIHDNRYEYSYTQYTGAHNKINIICYIHGLFTQRAGDHLKGYSCPKCVSSISAAETKWLDSLNIPVEYRNNFMYINGVRIKPDAYDPITNTVYEFNGDFWHGNPAMFNSHDINPKNNKTFGKLYEETQLKRNLILSAGYNLIEIWESEFRRQRI